MHKNVFLALGSNMGDPDQNIRKAVTFLNNVMHIDSISSLYHTIPYGKKEQERFENLVLFGESSIDPQDLMKEILVFENDMGRTRDEKWGPRIIDIDILFWGNETIDSENLKIPHYDYKKRDFFIVPAAEIAPNFTPPDSHKNLKSMAEEIEVTNILGRERFFESLHRD